MSDIDVLKNINSIIERDSTSTTYKFALLRSVIEVIQSNSPFIKKNETSVEIPFLLLIEKWVIYYYGIFNSEKHIPQINGSSKLAFERNIKDLIAAYDSFGGITSFYSDFRSGKIPGHIRPITLELFKVLRRVIYNMPMKHIGYSVNQYEYSIFQKSINTRVKRAITEPISFAGLMFHYGTFKLDKKYFDAFEIFGHFIIGSAGIINRWSEFSVNASHGRIKKDLVFTHLTDSFEIKRFTNEARRMILNSDQKLCVWSGKKYKVENLCIDHVLPISVFHSNDLWNLMPSTAYWNGKKSDKIPSAERFQNAKSRIISCWDFYFEMDQEKFTDQIQVALTGTLPENGWQEFAFEALVEKSKYLIDKRGLLVWS